MVKANGLNILVGTECVKTATNELIMDSNDLLSLGLLDVSLFVSVQIRHKRRIIQCGGFQTPSFATQTRSTYKQVTMRAC